MSSADNTEQVQQQEKAQQLLGSKPVQQVYQYPVQYATTQVVQQPPLVQSQLIAQPIQYVQQPYQTVVQGAHLQASQQQATLLQSQAVASGLVTTSVQREVVKGESRIEYIPYEKSVIEYEAVQRVEYVPKEKKITDYYAVEYQTEYIPQVYHDRYVEYIPTERVQERVEYQAVQKQIVHQPVQQQQQTVQTVVQPATTYVGTTQLQASTVTVPVVQQQYVPTASFVQTVPATTQVIQGAQYVQGAQYLQGAQYVQGAQYLQGTQSVVQTIPTAQFVQTIPTHTTSTLGVPVTRQALTSSGVRTLGPVSYTVVEEAIKKNQKKDE